MTGTTHAARLKHIALGGTASAVLTLDLRLREPDSFTFSPGQYSAIQLPSGEAVTLSIASGPSRLPNLRFLYKPTPGDPLADALDELLRIETTLTLRSPGGQVCWDVTASAPSLIVCAGTGIAQAFAILETVADQAPEQLPAYQLLALAGKEEEQISHPEEAHWEQAGLDLIRISDPALGADNPGLAWLAAAAPGLLETRPRVLIGGGPSFVHAVHETLTAAGLDPSTFAADVYEYAPR